MARRKKRRFRHFKIFFWICITAIIALIVVNVFIVKPHIFYPGFEINIPSGYEIHGIDVSRYQEKINWDEVKEMESGGIKIGFAIIKATEGITRTDPQFKRNWRETGEKQIFRGAYHFYIPGRDPLLQATNFIRRVNLDNGDLPPVLDIERTGNLSVAQMRNDVKIWLDAVEKHYGVVPFIYTNISFYEKYFDKGFEKYPLWIAHYLEPYKPRIEKNWIIWQHSETGRVNGIRSPVDFNVFYGDSADFNKLLINK